MWTDTGFAKDPARFGTVLNPKPDDWGCISVRLDCQTPHERGWRVKEDKAEPLTSDDTQFHLRTFNIFQLSHAHMMELRQAKLSPELMERIKAVPGFVP